MVVELWNETCVGWHELLELDLDDVDVELLLFPFGIHWFEGGFESRGYGHGGNWNRKDDVNQNGSGMDGIDLVGKSSYSHLRRYCLGHVDRVGE